MFSWLGLGLVMAALGGEAEGKKDDVLYCSACIAIADELGHALSLIDPKRTVTVGGFRLNPDGSLTDRKVPLSRSESHLSELLEGVCANMADYALYEDPRTLHRSYRRFAPRGSDVGGGFPDLKNFKFSGPEGSDSLKFACETIVEELEEEIISIFTQENHKEGVAQRLCSQVSAHCGRSVFQHAEL